MDIYDIYCLKKVRYMFLIFSLSIVSILSLQPPLICIWKGNSTTIIITMSLDTEILEAVIDYQ